MKYAHHQLLVQRKMKMTDATRLAVHYGHARRDVLLLGQASPSTRIGKLSAFRIFTIFVPQVLRLTGDAPLVSILPK